MAIKITVAIIGIAKTLAFISKVQYFKLYISIGYLKYYLPAGNLRVSFVDVRDIAAVAVKALTEDRNDNRHNEKIYTITGQMYYHTTKLLRYFPKQLVRKQIM
jgi:uncharacterized protein YbjT (DUF2867 family)